MITNEYLMRKAGISTLPESGAWVTIKGCPLWNRGERLIKAHRDIGIQHMDIYWAHKEEMTFEFKVTRRRRRRLSIKDAVYYDISQGASEQDAISRVVEEIQDYVDNAPFGDMSLQQTIITVSHPHTEEIKFYNSEIAVYTPETIRLLLQDDCLDVVSFGETQIPILEDLCKDIVDALQLDGLSLAEAYNEVMTTGIDPTMKKIIPQWFYRPKGWYRDMFCEEDC